LDRYDFNENGFDVAISEVDGFGDGKNEALITDDADVYEGNWGGEIVKGVHMMLSMMDEFSSIEKIIAEDAVVGTKRVCVFQRFREKMLSG